MKMLLVTLLLILSVSTSYGDIYKYFDEKGTPSFTNDFKSIPLKYRENAVLLGEDSSRLKIESSQAGKIDESLLPRRGEIAVSDAVSDKDSGEGTNGISYMNIIIISSLFLGTLAPAFFVNNRILKMVLRTASIASILTLLVYISSFYISRHILTLKKDSSEMTEAMKKKEAEKEKAFRDAIGNEPLNQENR